MAGLFDLSRRVALITGSSRGIGRAIAERMAEAGAKVVVSSRKLAACVCWERRHTATRFLHALQRPLRTSC